MTPLFFGSSTAPLYGVYHAPSSTINQSQAVLLCAPFGQEYMRSHRAFRQLAMLLNKQGYGVLRFDYKGTGDSYGEPEDASLQDWLENIVQAGEELRHSAQVQTISLVGLRLGGLLASYAASELGAVDRLVLWDTLSSGTSYLDELYAALNSDDSSKANKVIDAQGNLHFNGFTLSKRQIEELQALDLSELTPKANQVIQLCSSETLQQNQLKQAWSHLEHCQYQHIEAPSDWNFVDDFGGILLPQQIIQAIVGHFS